MISLIHLNPNLVRKDPRMFPAIQQVQPFIIRPKDFEVVDGDTIVTRMAPNEEGRRERGFSMRFRTLNAPEKKRSTHIERAFARMGAPSGITRGDLAANYLKQKMKDHGVLVVPAVDPHTGKVKLDRYNRVIADIYISGTEGPQFDIANAVSVQELMVSQGYASLNMSERAAPSRALDAIGAHARHMGRSFETPDDEGPTP